MKCAESIRMYKLHHLILSGMFTSARDVAIEWKVSQRTIERDLEALRKKIGAKVIYNREENRYVFDGEPAQLPSASFSDREIAVILIAERALRSLAGTPLQEEKVHPVFNKLLSLIASDEDLMDKARQFCGSVFFNLPHHSTAKIEQVFEKIAQALLDGKVISITYRKPQETTSESREVEPYFLLNENGPWYLVGRCRKKRDIREFNLSRIISIEVLDKYYVRPESFKADDYLKAGFGKLHGGTATTVQLKLLDKAAEWISENNVHTTQRVRHSASGGAILTMKCPISESLVQWVLQFGGHASVIGPPELRKKVIDAAQEIISQNSL